MPRIGRLREFRKPAAAGIRSWSISGFTNHLIFFRPVEDGVEILRVIHGAQDIDAIFEA
jgi:toxin ParE1/3/4